LPKASISEPKCKKPRKLAPGFSLFGVTSGLFLLIRRKEFYGFRYHAPWGTMKPLCRFIPPFTGVCTPLADEVWTAYSASSHVTPFETFQRTVFYLSVFYDVKPLEAVSFFRRHFCIVVESIHRTHKFCGRTKKFYCEVDTGRCGRQGPFELPLVTVIFLLHVK
jgi:hypothetical protein